MKAKEDSSRLIVTQMVKFAIFGGTAGLINIVMRYLFSDIFGADFFISVSVAYVIGMAANFLLNRNYNFPRGGRGHVQEIHSFVVIALFGLVLTNGLSACFLFVFGSLFSLNTMNLKALSHILAVCLVGLYSFFGHKYFTYKNGLLIGLRETFFKHDIDREGAKIVKKQ
jgi:putative flippase GtrA